MKKAPTRTETPVTAKPATKCTRHRSRGMRGHGGPSSLRTRAPLKGLHARSSDLAKTCQNSACSSRHDTSSSITPFIANTASLVYRGWSTQGLVTSPTADSMSTLIGQTVSLRAHYNSIGGTTAPLETSMRQKGVYDLELHMCSL